MEDLKEIIAKNLTQLRTHAQLTQIQLAEKLNYSDKAVSKWERGEAIPDIRVLIKLAEIYNISVDDIIKSAPLRKSVKPKMNLGKKRILVVALSVGLVWFVSTVLFMIFYFIPETEKYAYLNFVISPFVCGILLTVFSAKWGNWITNILSCSLIIWGAAAIFHVFVDAFSEFDKIYFLYIVAGVFEILIILWFILKKLALLPFKRKK